MKFLFSCIGRRGYIAAYLRAHLQPGDKIIGTSNNPWTPGFKYCDKGLILPGIKDEQYIPAVLHLCREKKIDVLLSFFDLDVVELSRHLEKFRGIGVLPVIPEAEIAAACFDKYLTHGFLAKEGIKSPATFLKIEEALDGLRSRQVGFPLVVKPRWGFGSSNTFYARNAEELKVFYSYAPDMIIQEMLTGDEYHLDIFNDLKGRVIAVMPKKKIAMRSGETDQAVTVKDPALLDFGVKLGSVLKHIGNLDVDLFMQDGEITVLEMNPRFGGGYPLTHLAGVDCLALLLRMVKGEKVAPIIGEFEDGVFMMKEYAFISGKEAHMWQ